jgi:hypothetical protein
MKVKWEQVQFMEEGTGKCWGTESKENIFGGWGYKFYIWGTPEIALNQRKS